MTKCKPSSFLNKWYLLLFKIEAGDLDIISVGETSRWDGLFIVRNFTSSHLFHLVTLKISTLIFSAVISFGIIYLYISIPKDSSESPSSDSIPNSCIDLLFT